MHQAVSLSRSGALVMELRPQQDDVLLSLRRFNVLLAHRRFGKTVLAICILILKALESKLHNPRVHYFCPTYSQAKRVAWSYVRDFCSHIPGSLFNESELKVTFPNGAVLQLGSADNPDANRGIYSDFAVMDEPDVAAMRKNFSVEVGTDGYVSRVVEKPRSPTTRLKGCGIYLFGPEIFDAIRKTPRTALRDEYELTTSLQILIDDGLKIAAERVVDWDLNVTFPKDLLLGNLHWLMHSGKECEVHPTARVSPDARVVRSVVGAGAVIPAGAVVEDSVVLPDTLVSAEEPLRRAICSPETVIRC